MFDGPFVSLEVSGPFSLLFIFFHAKSFWKTLEFDQAPYVASDLDLDCLSMTLLLVSRLERVNAILLF